MTMTRKQAKDVYAIQQGACNPRGIARALVESLDADSTDPRYPNGGPSAASMLILHQLIYILTGADGADFLWAALSNRSWSSDYAEVKGVQGNGA